MFDRGVYIIPGLPNSTAATQEMDQGYTEFQPAVKQCTDRVVSRKLRERVKARKNATSGDNEDNEATLKDLAAMLEVDTVDDDEGCEGGANVDVVLGPVTEEQSFTVFYKGSVCNVGLGNLDLGNMGNGFNNDLLEHKPFDFVFRRANILSWWKKVGFLPMTRNALNDPKVRYEVGEGGAPKDEGNQLLLLEEEYQEGTRILQGSGYNGGV